MRMPAARRPWTEKDDAALKAGHAAGKSMHSLSEEMQRSKGLLGRKAKALGISFSDPERLARTQTATQVKVVTNAARRQAVITSLYEEADAAIASIRTARTGGTFRTLLRGPGGSQVVQNLNFVPSEDFRNLTGAVSSLVGSAARLENVTTAEDASKTVSLLGEMAASLGLKDRQDAS